MAWKVLGRIRSAVNHHIYHLDRCGDTIEKYGLHFFNGKALKQCKDCVVSRSVFHMWLPALLTLIFGIRASIYILWPHWFDTRAKRLAIFSEILFENSRRLVVYACTLHNLCDTRSYGPFCIARYLES